MRRPEAVMQRAEVQPVARRGTGLRPVFLQSLPAQRPAGGLCPGLTLAELVVALAVMTVLVSGLVSAVLVASHALPETPGKIAPVRESHGVLARLTDELYLAQTFTERTVRTIEFTIPDRNGDTAPELVRYAWSGKAGDPLTRQYNAGTVQNLADDVQEFDVAYLFRTYTTLRTETAASDGPEILLASLEAWSGVTAEYRMLTLSPTLWVSEFFRNTATTPAGATALKITKVELMLQAGPQAGSVSVGIHLPATAGNPQPAASPIGTPATLPSSSLPAAFDWTGFTFTDVVITDLAQTDFVIVAKGVGAQTAVLQHLYSTNAPADVPVMLWSTDSGATWSPSTARLQKQNDAMFRVYGRYTASSDQQIETSRYFLTAAAIKLRVGADAAARLQTSVPLLNEPEVATP